MLQSDHSRRSPRFFLGVNESMLSFVGASILVLGGVLWSARGPNVEKTDFSLIYVGAQIVHRGDGARLYDMALQKQIRDSLFRHPNPLLYEHPPFEALAFSPIAGLSFRSAYLIWGIVNASVWLLTIWMLRPYLPRPREDLGYISLWLLFAPLGIALYQGQSSLFLLALYSITFVNLAENHEILAGAVLGFGLVKLQFVLPFAFIFLLLRKWRFIAGFAATAIFLGLLSLSAVGWQGILGYVHFLREIGSNPQNLSYGSAVDMPTLYGLVYALGGKWAPHWLFHIVVGGLSLGLMAVVAARWRSAGRRQSELMFASGVAASLVTGSHMFMHDFSPLALAMFLALANLPGDDHKWAVPLAATLIVFWTPPVYFLLIAYHCLYLMCPVLLVFIFATLTAAKPAQKSQSAAQFVMV